MELLPGTESEIFDNVLVAGQPRDRLRHERSLEAFRHGGRTARTLSKNVPAGVGSRNASSKWAGNLLIGSAGDHLPLYLLSSSNGGATEATQLAPDQTTQGYPYFLPDGNHFLLFRPHDQRTRNLRRLA